MSLVSVVPKKYKKYFPDYDYMQCHTWSMTDEEANRIMEKAAECDDNGDEEGYYKWMKKLPVVPNMAFHWLQEEGKEALLAAGWNLADAEIVYGKDWIDNYYKMLAEEAGEDE